MIPNFDPTTNALPAGIHAATWAEIVARFGTTPTRQRLLGGLYRALRSFAGAGCTRVYLGGSFVTARADPGDWDLAWEVVGVDPDLLDPVLLDFSRDRFLQKLYFLGEAFPAHWIADTEGTTYINFFQQNVDGQAVGIVTLDPRTT
jgi:hypothetical protein